MNEMKKLLLLVGTGIVFIILVIVISLSGGKKSEQIYNAFLEAFNSSENTLIYVGRPTCRYCSFLEPNLLDMKDRYDFDYVYVNTDNMSSKHIKKVMNALKMDEMATPHMAIVSNGKVIDTQGGYEDYDVTFEFLKENNIISEDSELLLNYIGLKEYNELLKSKEESIIVVGQSFCGYCTQAKITLNNIVEENQTMINYFNLSNLSQEEGEEFESSLEYFQGSWGTPITMIVKDGKIVDMLEEYVQEDEYIEFFEENGVL